MRFVFISSVLMFVALLSTSCGASNKNDLLGGDAGQATLLRREVSSHTQLIDAQSAEPHDERELHSPHVLQGANIGSGSASAPSPHSPAVTTALTESELPPPSADGDPEGELPPPSAMGDPPPPSATGDPPSLPPLPPLSPQSPAAATISAESELPPPSADGDPPPPPPAQSRKYVVLDVGSNGGEDTEAYLRQGYYVVSVEPNPIAMERAKARVDISTALTNGSAVLLNAGVRAPDETQSGNLPFYRNVHNDAWSSFNRDTGCVKIPMHDTVVSDANCKLEYVSVIGCDKIVEDHVISVGKQLVAAKIDAEGQETNCLRGFEKHPEFLPTYVQVEVDKLNPRAHMPHLVKLGYQKFKLVDQTYFGLTSGGSSPFGETAVDIQTQSTAWRSADEMQWMNAQCIGERTWCDLVSKREQPTGNVAAEGTFAQLSAPPWEAQHST
jgi:FkbM family methyltransferase